jgi:2-polyprenyl-6-methoxyphenol hydroxylase-like FAD-dependent oxidoreductase
VCVLFCNSFLLASFCVTSLSDNMLPPSSVQDNSWVLPAASAVGCAVAFYGLRRLFAPSSSSGQQRRRAPRPHELRVFERSSFQFAAADDAATAAAAGAPTRTRRPLRVVIVGGGPCGALAACYLARAGHSVDVLERDTEAAIEDMAGLPVDVPEDGGGGGGGGGAANAEIEMGGGKATGVTLYPRGRRALCGVMTQREFDQITVPLVGRTVHAWDSAAAAAAAAEAAGGDSSSSSSSNSNSSKASDGARLVLLDAAPHRHEMHTINRPGCQATCLRIAQRHGARVHFGVRAASTGVDVEAPSVCFTQRAPAAAAAAAAAATAAGDAATKPPPQQEQQLEQQRLLEADLIIGADGAFSCVREAVVRDRVYCLEHLSVQAFTHGWKRVRVRSALAPLSDPVHRPAAAAAAASGGGGGGAGAGGGVDSISPAVRSASGKLRHDTMHLWPLPAPANGIVISTPQANGDGLDAAIVLPHGPDAARLAGKLPYRHGPWHLERLQAGGQAEVRAFFDAVLPEMVLLDPSVVGQFCASLVGKFCSASVAPYHYKGKLVLMGDAAHAMTGFWGQGMNMALEDAAQLAALLREAEQEPGQGQGQGAQGQAQAGGGGAASGTTAHVQAALERFSLARAPSGRAIVGMSMKHLTWFTDKIGSRLYRWRQAYQQLMHALLPSLYYPPLAHILHFCDLSYADTALIEEEHEHSWSIGAL